MLKELFTAAGAETDAEMRRENSAFLCAKLRASAVKNLLLQI